MPYGFELFTKDGDAVLDGTQTMGIRETGTCRSVNDWDTQYPDGPGLPEPWIRQTVDINDWEHVAGDLWHFVGNNLISYSTSSGTRRVADYILAPQELAFVSIPASGITNLFMSGNRLPDFPSGETLFVGAYKPSSPIRYVIMSRDNGQITPSTYGAQVYAANGDVLFDSRVRNLGIAARLTVWPYQSENILMDGDTIDFPLPQPTPNALIMSSDFNNYAITQSVTDSGDHGRFIKITQPNRNTIRLSRQIWGNGSHGSIDRTRFERMELLVARNVL